MYHLGREKHLQINLQLVNFQRQYYFVSVVPHAVASVLIIFIFKFSQVLAKLMYSFGVLLISNSIGAPGVMLVLG